MILDLRNPGRSRLTLRLPRSKSILIRYLIYSYQKQHLLCPVEATEAEDAHIVRRGLEIVDRHTGHVDMAEVDVEDCGAALRFFLPLLATTPGQWLLTGTRRNLSRPLQPLVESLRRAGALIAEGEDGLSITGRPLQAGEIAIDCRQSSQFASALLLSAIPLGLQKLDIFPFPPPSHDYILLTEKVIERVNEGSLEYGEIEADWSAALFWYAYVALNPGVECFLPRLQADSAQGDRIIAEWFPFWGVSTRFTAEGIGLENPGGGSPGGALRLDVRNHPDTVPLLAVLAILSRTDMVLQGVGNLDFKESPRLEILMRELSPFAGMELLEEGAALRVKPRKRPENLHLQFKSHQDHRILMAFSLFALYNTVEFDEIDSVKKSYPSFFRDLLSTI